MEKKEPKYLYVEVTRDKYELPVRVADSVGELAKMMGTSPQNISCMLNRKKRGNIKKTKVIKVLNDPNGYDKSDRRFVRYQIYKITGFGNIPIGLPMKKADVSKLLCVSEPMISNAIYNRDGVILSYKIERVMIDEQ